MRSLAGEIQFLWYTLFHPFNGFYELRFRRKRSWVLILTIFLLCGIIEILRLYYTGMSIQTTRVYYVNTLFTIIAAVFPYFIFALSNWSVTTLFNGNGSLGDVIMVVAYALAPKLFFDAVYIGLSNIVTTDEAIMLNAVAAMGMIIFCFLVFAGLCVVHEYLAARCIITLFATAAAAVIIVFVGAIYLILMGKLTGFVYTIAQELLKRGVY